ncbi:MAG: hypothetical protein QME83_03200 [Thermodesulfobacteriota bacterium]|nr:hypothetical protein [Thermodesulfobacteriota bacterium]
MKRKTNSELKVVKGKILTEVNPVRNSSRCDSKPSGALNSTGIILKSNPAAEQRSIISNGVKNYLGLCSCCSCAPACTYPRDSGRPVLQCDEFDGISPPLNQMMKCVEKPSVNRFSGPIPDAQSLSILRGLCAYCDGLNTCTYPKPEGGVWHCEEYC